MEECYKEILLYSIYIKKEKKTSNLKKYIHSKA